MSHLLDGRLSSLIKGEAPPGEIYGAGASGQPGDRPTRPPEMFFQDGAGLREDESLSLESPVPQVLRRRLQKHVPFCYDCRHPAPERNMDG